MSVTWIVEAEVFPNECKPLIEEIKKQGMKCVVVKFGNSYEDYIEALKDAPTILYGSLQFAAIARRKSNWHIYCNLPKFECVYYYPRFGDNLLNSNYVMLPFGELDRKKDWLFSNVGKDNSLFIRPNSGNKLFTGKVTTTDIWDKDIKHFGFYDVDPEALVVVAAPAEIKREWRGVVVDNKIISHSQYKVDDGCWGDSNLPMPVEVLQYGEEVLKSANYSPDPVWTIDLCETQSGDLKVCEVGSLSCAGLYSCNPEPIVREVSRIAIQEVEDLG
jgi:hypothetical protein